MSTKLNDFARFSIWLITGCLTVTGFPPSLSLLVMQQLKSPDKIMLSFAHGCNNEKTLLKNKAVTFDRLGNRY